MATLTVTCPACKKVFEVPAREEGESVECPECFEAFKAEKSSGPKLKVVVSLDPPTGKNKKRPRRRDEDEDDYEHDHRRDDDDDDDDDYSPPRGRRVYRGIRSPGTTLTLGILSLLLVCIPFVGLILAIVTLTGPSTDVYHPDDRGIVRTGKWIARVVIGLQILAVLAALGYFSN